MEIKIMGFWGTFISFIIDTLFMLWVLFWGGAKFLENIFARFLFLGTLPALFDWKSDQIKFYVLLLWIGHTIYSIFAFFV